MANLNGIALVVTVGPELTELRRAPDEAGANTSVVSSNANQVRGWMLAEWRGGLPVDLSLDKSRSDQFFAPLLPGGVDSTEALRTDEKAVAFVKALFVTRKPVSSVCPRPRTLIAAFNREMIKLLRSVGVPSWQAAGK